VIGVSSTNPAQGPALESCNTGDGDAGDVTLDAPVIVAGIAPTFDLSATSGEGGLISTGGAETTLVEIVAFDSHEDCEGRAEIWRLGLDDGLPSGIAGDAVLSVDEVDDAVLVCSEAEASAEAGRLFDSEIEPPGANCEAGGTRIRSGTDGGDEPNNELDDDEVSETAYICDDPTEDVGDADGGGDASEGRDADDGRDAGDFEDVAEQPADVSVEPDAESSEVVDGGGDETAEPAGEVDGDTTSENDDGSVADGEVTNEAEGSGDSSGCSCRQIGAQTDGFWLVMLCGFAWLVSRGLRDRTEYT